jgi:hypothetical protein
LDTESTGGNTAINSSDCGTEDATIKDVTTRSFRECTVLEGITQNELNEITHTMLAQLGVK